MKRDRTFKFAKVSGCRLAIDVAWRLRLGVAAEPTPAAVAAFNSYIGTVEARLAEQHRSADGFLGSEDFARLRRGE